MADVNVVEYWTENFYDDNDIRCFVSRVGSLYERVVDSEFLIGKEVGSLSFERVNKILPMSGAKLDEKRDVSYLRKDTVELGRVNRPPCIDEVLVVDDLNGMYIFLPKIVSIKS
jgi:hypothetical protein